MKYSSLTLGQIEAIINKLGGEDGALRFLRSDQRFIDGDADPSIPHSPAVKRIVYEHKKIGPFLWDPARIAFWQHPLQQQPGPKPATAPQELYRAARHRPVLNANVLDYLLKNPSLIPKEWEDKTIVFWGTTYLKGGEVSEEAQKDIQVRYLIREEGWTSYYLSIGAIWLGLPDIYSAEYQV